MYLNRLNIFGEGRKKSSINHINLVNLSNALQHLSLGTLAVVTDIFSSSWNCSAASSSCHLPSLLPTVLFLQLREMQSQNMLMSCSCFLQQRYNSSVKHINSIEVKLQKQTYAQCSREDVPSAFPSPPPPQRKEERNVAEA